MMRSQEGKSIRIKTPFDVEDLRTELAIKKNYSAFKKTYSDKYPEIKATNSSRFWDAKFKTSTKFKDLDPMTKDKINTIIKFLPVEGSRILDLGIGQGYLEQRLQEIGKNYKLYGIDISERAIIRLKKKFKGKFNTGNVLKIKGYYKKNYFDVIVAIELVEHISPGKILAFYKDISSLLKPHGVLILSTPLNEGLRYGIENLSSHVREYTEPTVKTELKISGFKVLKSRSFFAFKNLYSIKKVLTLLLPGRWRPNNIVIKAVKA
jgi:2-polyprenyl-3-methyl-5-hydroxy-6-metoxy-1,4-benzoquinol methylase